MWKLTIEDDEGQRTSLDLNQTEYTIGRGEETDIRLTERNISRKHCVLRQTGEGWEIVDDGSYNGSYVNGERVTAEGTVLANGDVVNIGDYRIELIDAAEIVDDDEPRQRRPDRLVMVIGPSPGMEYALDGDRLGIGRAEEAYVSINHASVSRMHAELQSLGHGRWEVVDQGSSNGIRINGVELRRGIIEPGDALELGDVRLRFVAAGKFFRPAVDLSQQLPAMPFDMTASAGPAQSAGRSMGMVFVGVALLGALLVAGYAMFGGTDTGPKAQGSAKPLDNEQAKAILDEAKKHADAGDIQKAHKQIERIPEDSSVRESPELKAIEDKWADEMFKKAEETQSPDDKIRIFELISDAVSVSAEKRKQAARRALEVKPIDDLDDPDPPSPNTNPAFPKPGTVPGTPDPGGPDPVPTNTDPKPDPSPSTQPSSEPAGKPKFDPKANKNRLYNKVASGNASESEIRQLKALCMLDGDRACRAMAVNALKAAKNK